MTPEIRSLLALVHRHYRNAHGVGFYRARLGMTTENLDARCLDELGVSAKQVVAGKILERARALLVKGDAAAAAKAVGFSTASGLQGFIKRSTGKTLTEYKNRYSP